MKEFTFSIDIAIKAHSLELAMQKVNELLAGLKYWVGDITQDKED